MELRDARKIYYDAPLVLQQLQQRPGATIGRRLIREPSPTGR
jgi:hypothetical protein